MSSQGSVRYGSPSCSWAKFHDDAEWSAKGDGALFYHSKAPQLWWMILAEAWRKLVFSAELRSLPTTQIPQTFLAESIIIPFPPTLVEIQLRPKAPVKSHGHCASLRDLREMGGGKGAAAACTSPLVTSVGL